MQTSKLFLAALILSLSFSFSACLKINNPMSIIEGTYSGTMNISGDTSIQDAFGYEIIVSAIDNKRAMVECNDFPTFEVDVVRMPSGVVSADGEEADLVYTKILSRMTLSHDIGNNSMSFTGTK